MQSSINLSASNILNESTKIKSSIDIKTNSDILDENYFIESISATQESITNYYSGSMKLYADILNADRIQSVQESAADFVKFVLRAILEKAIKLIKSIFIKLKNALLYEYHNDKFIKSNKDCLRDFNDTMEFDIQGFNYSVNDNNVPNIDKLSEILNTIKKGLVSKDFNVDGTKEEFLSKIYASCLNSPNKNIDIGSFTDEVRSIFRGGVTDKHKIVVSKSVVNEALSTYENFDKMLSSIESNENNIVGMYEKTDSELTKLNASELSKNNLSEEEKIKFSNWVKQNSNRITIAVNTINIVFAAKATAVKEQFIQNRHILYKAINKVQTSKV